MSNNDLHRDWLHNLNVFNGRNMLKKSIIIITLLLTSVSYAQLRDPTQPATYYDMVKGNHGLVITSILYSPHRRVAIVNEKHVQEGDEILNVKVVTIKPNFVIFTR